MKTTPFRMVFIIRDDMKVIYNVPVDIDELIFAGESTVPSER